MHGRPAGAVCEGCKVKVAPFAVDISRDLEAEGLLGAAVDYGELAVRLARETGLDQRRG